MHLYFNIQQRDHHPL